MHSGASGPAADEAVVVLGIKPEYFKVLFFPGDEKSGVFVQNPWRGAVINGLPTNGYIVAKVKADELIGLTMISNTNEGLLGKAYSPCGGARGLVLRVPRAQLIYLGDIEYTAQGSQIGVHYGDDLSAAEQFLRTHFPDIKGDLLRAEARAMPVAKSCSGGTTYVPIYIKGR
jgi:hypothetical protein